MRTLTDSTGVEWTVIEVKGTSLGSARWHYLPQGFGGGWLCFESRHAKRRLTPVPDHWGALTDEKLEALLWQALPVEKNRSARTILPDAPNPLPGSAGVDTRLPRRRDG